jgi:hypothetical protein
LPAEGTPTASLTRTAKKPAAAARPAKDERAAEIAKKAAALAPELKTPITAKNARVVIDYLTAQEPAMSIPDRLAVSEKALRDFARGKTDGTAADAKTAVRAMGAEIKDRMVWGRKLALILLAIHTDAKVSA